MTIQLTYPGVYVEPIITAAPGNAEVATSVTAFIGRTPMGPVNEPVLVNSFGEYEQRFGGLNHDSTISYSVQQFFDNGGGQALIVRCFAPYIDGADAVASLVRLGDRLVSDAKTVTPALGTKKAYMDYLTAAENKAEGADRWFIGQMKTSFDNNPKASKPSPAKADLEGALSAAVTAATPALPPFSGAMKLGPTEPAFEVIRAIMIAASGQVASAPNNQSGVVFAAKQVAASFTDPISKSVAETLIEAMAAAPVPTDDSVAAQYAASGAIAQVGYALAKFVTAPVGVQVATLKPKANSPAATFQTFLAAFTGAISGTDPGNWTGAAKVFVEAVKAFQTPPTGTGAGPLPDAATVYNAVKAAASGAALAPIDAAAKTASQADDATAMSVLQAAVDGAIDALKENWVPLVDVRLAASSPGTWSNDALSASVNAHGINAQVAQVHNLDAKDLFNLVVEYMRPDGSVARENHTSVTLQEKDLSGNKTPRHLGTVLRRASMLVRLVEDDSDDANTPVFTPMDGAAGSAAGGGDSEPLSIQDYIGDEAAKQGIYALKKASGFNIMCVPPDIADNDTSNLVYATAATFCVANNAMLIIDPPVAWAQEVEGGNMASVSLQDLGSFGAPEGRSSVTYFPRVVIQDALMNGANRTFPASGTIAGIWASTDRSVGVWKAPAGLNAALNAVAGLELDLTNDQDGVLNPQGINCLRTFPIGGSVVWGARTLRGATALADEYRYVPVRRLLLYIMDWLELNTRWAVFEPNDETLWSSLRLQIGEFMKGLYKEGALVGASADQAFFVRCDASTTTPEDQDNGIVNVQVGFAPVKPAEFVVVTVQQIHQAASA